MIRAEKATVEVARNSGYGFIGSIVSWCDAMKGSVPLRDGLGDLLAGLGAEAGMLVRTDMQDLRTTRVATVDRGRGTIAMRQLTRSFADSYFGKVLACARTGTIWIASAHADDRTGNPALDEWQASRRMGEFVVIVLSSGGAVRDHLELHFRDRLTAEDQATLAAILPDVVRVWAGRKHGLIARSIANPGATELRARSEQVGRHLLSAENPARLSRAEFRVCMLLSRGLLAQAAAHELKLSEATIRTHLRNIYAKTDSACMAELVFRLMDGNRSANVQPEARYA